MKVQSNYKRGQSGLSLVGFIFVIGIIALLAVMGMKVVPTVIEYSAVKKAIAMAKATGQSAPEIRTAFDRQAEVGYIESVSGKDLEITRESGGIEVSVAYQKKLPCSGRLACSSITQQAPRKCDERRRSN
ncbi:DUF4845 domain-containing protein [Noviherbaspirillum massiliense]|uniref:DUF4845 domain-containing protein n=1 Tax=Noviherbaspirillum massiliense TaxID=1465823 RepID=UPI001FDED722|nr:DUF4845 domain-containing protein [Noviherbaspirillum massiliense]